MDVNPVLERLELGDLVCCPVAGTHEWWQVAAAGVAGGLRRDCQVVAVVRNPGDVTEFLESALTGIDRAVTRDQLRVLAPESVYTVDGTVDGAFPDARVMVDRWATMVETSLRRGFAGLFAVGGLMGLSLMGRPESVDRLIETEVALHSLFASGHLGAICGYDPKEVDAGHWERVVTAHPSTVVPGSRSVVSRLRAEWMPDGLRLVGEADLANHAVVTSLLTDLTAFPGTCRIDATAVTFADVRTLGCLLRLADSRAPEPTVIECGVHVGRNLAILGSDDLPTLSVRTVEES